MYFLALCTLCIIFIIFFFNIDATIFRYNLYLCPLSLCELSIVKEKEDKDRDCLNVWSRFILKGA